MYEALAIYLMVLLAYAAWAMYRIRRHDRIMRSLSHSFEKHKMAAPKFDC